MFGDFLERFGDIFSDGGNYNHDVHNDIVSGLEHSGVDLSMYSADEIKEAMKVAMGTDGIDGHGSNYGHDISFGASPDVDARNVAKSTLISKLSTYHIYTSSLYTDRLWGGLDSYSGDIVYDAINDARNNQSISDSVYNELIALLKKACHSQ
jgi:hypothetical protein